MPLFSKKKDKNPENFEDILKQFGDLKQRFDALASQMEDLKKESASNLKNFGLIRFNPFSDIGGNQSFSLAILDQDKNGIVITSLFTRHENRVYGKPIKRGASEYKLTDEEKEAIELAFKKQ